MLNSQITEEPTPEMIEMYRESNSVMKHWKKQAVPASSGAQSGALVAGDDVLARLLKLWPMLSDEARQAVLAHAQQLALSPVTLQKVPSAGHSDTIMEQYQEAVAVFLTGRKP